MKSIKSIVLYSLLVASVGTPMAQPSTKTLAPNALKKYIQQIEMPIEQSFHYFAMDVDGHRAYLATDDFNVLNKAVVTEQQLMLEILKAQAKVFQKACKTLETFSVLSKPQQVNLMVNALETADKLERQLYVDRYNEAMTKLSDAGHRFMSKVLPEMSQHGSTSVINWQAMAKQDLATLQTMFEMSCQSLAEIDDDSELTVTTQQEGSDTTQNTEQFGKSFTTFQLKKKDHQ